MIAIFTTSLKNALKDLYLYSHFQNMNLMFWGFKPEI
jgi:hypothetical protein